MTSATQGTVAGRPQPQTSAQPAGGPFVRHAPDGRRAMYVAAGAAGGTAVAQFVANPMVSSPGWNKGYRVLTTVSPGTGTSGAATLTNADAPFSFMQLVQMKDAFGTQLLTGPGFDIAYLIQLYGGQFGTDDMRNPMNSPQFSPVLTGTLTSAGGFQFPTYFPFEFAKGYGVISGANAALLPVLQINLAPISSVVTYTFTSGATSPSSSLTVDSDFYWLPNVPTDPPGIGTTCQWIYQPCNPTIPSGASSIIQLPRLGGYLTTLILDLRDANGLRIAEGFTGATATGLGVGTGWPTRPKILVDGVPLIDSLFGTIIEDLAIATANGPLGGGFQSTATQSTTVLANPSLVPTATGNGAPVGLFNNFRPPGTLALSRKTSLAQRDFGLLDTGEIFLSTNPGTQIEVAGYPWGTVTNGPMTLNAIVGQVVPSGTLVQGLPEV